MDIVSEHPVYSTSNVECLTCLLERRRRAFSFQDWESFRFQTLFVNRERREVRLFVASISELSFCFTLPRIIIMPGEDCYTRLPIAFIEVYNCRENKKLENNSHSLMYSRKCSMHILSAGIII